MIIYAIISIADVKVKSRRETFDIEGEKNVLKQNILDSRYQWAFKPINVIRYKQGGLRSKRPPFEYHTIDADGAKRYWIHVALGLTVIRARIDTTFREDGKNAPNPFPNTWTPDLGMSNVAQEKLAKKQFAMYKRKDKWVNMLIHTGRIKHTIEKVAVILTTYNRPTLVQKAIRSVFNQTYKNWHLYIVDNNSNALTKSVLRRYKNSNPTKVTLNFLNTKDSERLNRCWLSHMINLAMRKSREQYITLLTDDCWITPKKLEVMVRFMDNHPSCMICYGTQIIVNIRGRELRRRPANRAIPPNSGAGILDHNQVLFRRTLIKRVGYWNESKHVMGAPDADFWNRIPYPKYPINVVTDYYLEHNKRFQHFFYGRKGTRNQLKNPMVME